LSDSEASYKQHAAKVELFDGCGTSLAGASPRDSDARTAHGTVSVVVAVGVGDREPGGVDSSPTVSDEGWPSV
jgi:hypothetical protein